MAAMDGDLKTGRPALVARPAPLKTWLVLVSGVFVCFVPLWLVIVSTPDAICMWDSSIPCPRRERPAQYVAGFYLGLIGLPLFVFGVGRFAQLRLNRNPYLVIDDNGIWCRQWSSFLSWQDIKLMQVNSSWSSSLPTSWQAFNVRLTTKMEEAWNSATGLEGVKRAIMRHWFEMTLRGDKAGHYRLSLVALDTPALQIVDELNVRIVARYRQAP